MRKFFNRRNVLLAVTAIVVVPILVGVMWLESASPRGRWAARSDLAHGHYRMLAYGLPPAEVYEYRNLLQQRYAIEYRQVAFCIVGLSTKSYADAYDAVSGPAIEAKFGANVFKNSWDEASKSWKEKHQAELQNVSRASEEAHPASSR